MKNFCLMVLIATVFLLRANAQTVVQNANTNFSPAPDLTAEEIEMKVNAANPYTLFKNGTIAEYCFQYKGKQTKYQGDILAPPYPTYLQQIVSYVKIQNGLLVVHVKTVLLKKNHEQPRGTGHLNCIFPVEIDTAGNYHLTHNFIEDIYCDDDKTGFGVFIPGIMQQGMQLKTSSLYEKYPTLVGGTMKQETKYSDWKVEGEETITTPAGTFECVKLSGSLAQKKGKVGRLIEEQITCWMARGIGIVRYETVSASSKNKEPLVIYLNKIESK